VTRRPVDTAIDSVMMSCGNVNLHQITAALSVAGCWVCWTLC